MRLSYRYFSKVFKLSAGPLICLSGIAVVLNVFDKGSAGQLIATIPEFFWEFSLGIYLMVKGFKPAASA